jgi:hypothetical protein
MNELEFQGLLIAWTETIAAEEPALPFRRLRQEMPLRRIGTSDATRRDIVLVDASGKPLVSGELRLPDHPLGKTPDVYEFVENAFIKAQKLGLRYYFTWNINGAIVWDAVEPTDLSFLDRRAAQFHLQEDADIHVEDRRELDDPILQQRLQTWWRRFLHDLADRVQGRIAPALLPLDEQFVGVLEFALQPVIRTVHQGLAVRFRSDKRFAQQLTRWMRHDQQWVFDPPGKLETEGLRAAARLGCYTMMLRLVFYEALRRQEDLPHLFVPTTTTTSADLRRYLEERFRHVQQKTKDYEVLFTLDFADDIALLSDRSVEEWRDLIADISRYDLARLPYEVVGLIFQRLISPEERHKYGQYYTPATIVDLIHAFCLRDAKALYYDPATGGGTFPVRAYVRKRYLDPEMTHQETLATIWASDISKFAASLATVNLATRELVATENYPLVAQHDFFDISTTEPFPFLSLPVELTNRKAARRERGKFVYSLPQVNAMACNLPYVRQEEVDKEHVNRALMLDYHGRPPRHSRRSDLHVYFWLHAWNLLAPGGYFGFLTSAAWLETSYGFDLQAFLLDRFAIKGAPAPFVASGGASG